MKNDGFEIISLPHFVKLVAPASARAATNTRFLKENVIIRTVGRLGAGVPGRLDPFGVVGATTQ